MKILVAMSGGVDSSVTARLLTEAGHTCIGCTMKLYDNEDIGIPRFHTCCSLSDVEDARSVAYQLGMRYYVFNFSDDFCTKVIDKFVDSYRHGRTPNPCIDCNRYMKFDKLFDRARLLGCDHVATGHYARIEFDGRKYRLKKAVDETKDQSYVLYTMTQDQLAHTLFPLGTLHKTETRRIAEENNFINAAKPDSQDICFVPDGDYVHFIERYTGEKAQPGNFVDRAGNVLGQHHGIIGYTIGQRRVGLALSDRRYVCRICPEHNTVVLGAESDLYRQDAEAVDFNWISGAPPERPIRCTVKTRYRQPEQEAEVVATGTQRVNIHFDRPQRAITPGQAAVVYDGDVVLGGGMLV